MFVCWKCQTTIGPDNVRVGFREACPKCETPLHSCINCRFYAPGKPNDCLVPGTDWIRDREASNLCDEFKPKLTSDPSTPPKEDPLEKAKKMLGF